MIRTHLDLPDNIESRKKEHLVICSSDEAAFQRKTTGFEKYDFIHDAFTEVDLEKISFDSKFFYKTVSYPFLISCMTGGTDEANNINKQLAEAAKYLNIPLGLGSLRYAINNKNNDAILREFRSVSGNIPLLANIGAAQIIEYAGNISPLKKIAELTEADAFVVHLNPLQELMQKEGQPKFTGLVKALEHFVKEINLPVIVKEVGSGINKSVAKTALECGVMGIDVAGSGGTSWSAVEMIRNKMQHDEVFWEWGIPTAVCINEVRKLKKHYDFLLIGSGGINDAVAGAKALALGSDFIASARILLHTLNSGGPEAVVRTIEGWFNTIKKIMFLTGASTLQEFDQKKISRIKDYH